MNFFKKIQFVIGFLIILLGICINCNAGVLQGPDTGTITSGQIAAFTSPKTVTNTPASIDNNGNITTSEIYFNTNNQIGIISFTNAYSLLITNQSFTYMLPDSVKTQQVSSSVQIVTNSSGSLINITAPLSWNINNGPWNCTNVSVITLTVYPLVMTNAICTPLK